MQWILDRFEDHAKLAETLDRMGLAYSVHKIVPFVGELIPEPDVPDKNDVILFGAYGLWRYAKTHGLRPGVFRIRPFLHETPWQAHMLNGPNARVLPLRDVPEALAGDQSEWFVRPVSDSKAIAGQVLTSEALCTMAAKVLALDPEDVPRGSLRPETDLMLTRPARIHKEWRLWVVDDRLVTYSLYKEGARVVYRAELDEDARQFAEDLISLNPAYAPAYVLDIAQTAQGLELVETNCLNAAGFYAADLQKLVAALEDLSQKPR